MVVIGLDMSVLLSEYVATKMEGGNRMNAKVEKMVQAVTEVYCMGDDANTELLMGGINSLYECGAITEEEMTWAEQQLEAVKKAEEEQAKELPSVEDETVLWIRQNASEAHELLQTSLQLTAEFLHDYWSAQH